MGRQKRTKQEFIREYFSVPNVLSYVRLVLIGVYLAVYIGAETTADYYAATVVLFISMMTDFLDGQIARRCNMITQWGKMLDPVADKLTLGSVLLGFTFRYPLMRTVVAVFLVKELFQGIAGLLFMKTGWRTDGAIWSGKVATAGLYAISIVMLFLPDLSIAAVNVLMLLELVLMFAAFAEYIELYTEVAKELYLPGGMGYGHHGDKVNMAEIKERIRGRRKMKRIILIVALVFFVVYLIAGAVIPFVKQPEIKQETLDGFRREDYYGTEECVDRAKIIEDNKEALDERLRLIGNAKEKVILSTFSFCSDESGKDMLAALLDAADRGVKVEVFADGFNSWVNMEGNAYFYALSAHPNAEIILYNKINLLKPWTGMGRMHDKYLIVDDTAYILGGRNTFGYFLGDYPGYKNHDRDVFVYNTAKQTARSFESSLFQVEEYYQGITALDCCTLFHDKASIAEWGSVKRAAKELRRRMETIRAGRPELFSEDYDYMEHTVPTKEIRLISNPTGIYAKEPVAFYRMMQLAQNAEKSVYIHTPYAICNKVMYEELEKAGNKAVMLFNSAANNGNIFAAVDYMMNKEALLKTGIQILEYEGRTSYHAKSMVIDDRLSLVGSFNMDMRSAYLDTELMLVVDSPELAHELRHNMEIYEASSAVVKDLDSYSYIPEGMTLKELSAKKKMFARTFWWALKKLRFLL